jgi:hypothetical protein
MSDSLTEYQIEHQFESIDMMQMNTLDYLESNLPPLTAISRETSQPSPFTRESSSSSSDSCCSATDSEDPVCMGVSTTTARRRITVLVRSPRNQPAESDVDRIHAIHAPITKLASVEVFEHESMYSLYAREDDAGRAGKDPIIGTIGTMLADPDSYWCWRLHSTDGKIGSAMNLSSFMQVSPFEELWAGTHDDTGMIYLERRTYKSAAWDAHTWSKPQTGWSAAYARENPSTNGWFTFNLASARETCAAAQLRVGTSGCGIQHRMYRLLCPLDCIDTSTPTASQFMTPVRDDEQLFRGSATLTGCFLFFPVSECLPVATVTPARVFTSPPMPTGRGRKRLSFADVPETVTKKQKPAVEPVPSIARAATITSVDDSMECHESLDDLILATPPYPFSGVAVY